MSTITTVRLADEHIEDAEQLIEHIASTRYLGGSASRSDVLRFAIDIGLAKLKRERDSSRREDGAA